MTLLWMDGFEDGLDAYVLGGTVNLVAGRGASGSSACPVGYGRFETPIIDTASTTLCVSFAAYFTTPGTQPVFFLGDGRAVEHVVFEFDSSFNLSARRGYGGTVIWGPTATGIVINSWNHFELLVTLSDTVGAIKVWLNGVQIGTSPTNLDTKNGGTGTVFTALKFCSNGNVPSNDTRIDDLYVYDTLGSYNNAAPIGDVTVEHLRPNANATVQWVPSAGSNYACVDEAGAYTTADYVSSSTVGERDVYELTSSVRSTGACLGVMVTVMADKSDTAARSIAPVVRDSNGTRVGGNKALAMGAVSMATQCYDRRNDGAAITLTELAGMGVGVEVTV